MKSSKILVSVADFRAESWTQDLENKHQEYEWVDDNVSYKGSGDGVYNSGSLGLWTLPIELNSKFF
jgi:hypothetical protein